MIRLSDILTAVPSARVHGPRFAERFDGFCFDSRIVQPGQLFLAVKTDKADGHDYIEDACLGGASGVLCQRPPDVAALGATCVVVPDTVAAIQEWARHRMATAAIPVVAITGSVGKTTTKEMMAHVLSSERRVFRNPANYSGYFGLPIALGRLTEAHELAILEMSTDRFGEIELQARLAPPNVACVTRVAPAHLDAFGDEAGVAREKGALIEALQEDGLAVLNASDPRVAAMAERTAARVAWVSHDAGQDGDDGAPGGEPHGAAHPDVCSIGAPRLTREGTHFQVRAEGDVRSVRIPWLGEHFVTGVMMTIVVARHFGVPWATIIERLSTLPSVPGRLVPLPGLEGSLLLDDSYNASPAAVKAALDVLARVAGSEPVQESAPEPGATGHREGIRRIAVLGDMAELGEASEGAHRAVGAHAAGRVDLLVTRGEEAVRIADGAREAGMDPERIVVTMRAADAVAAVEPHLRPGVTVLAKGSAVTRMERVVAALMAEPEHAKERLVRQDDAWQQIVVLRRDRPTWLEIDLTAVAHNVRLLTQRAEPAELMAVIKADAYGHGGDQVARTALLNGASRLGVACVPEGAALRRAGIDAPILVLGYTPAWQAREAARMGLTLTLFDEDTARAASAAAEGLDRPVAVHVKVDTGLHRLGVPPGDVPQFLEMLRMLPEIEIEGIFTHFAVADDMTEEGREATDAQLRAFDGLLQRLDADGTRPPVAHAANSAALLTRPEARYDMVRPGIALYGLAPSPEVTDPALRPALSWKTQVAQVLELDAGEAVGYGRTWTAERPSRIATLPVGYADGFRRAPSRWCHVLVRGRRAPLVGRVSMDQATVDVTDIDGVRQGDEVVLIGVQDGARITAEQVADWLGTINYEVVSSILARVTRAPLAR